jgi:non-specific serine/threonine protein kinase/serine/threonine-protein kinase
MTDDIDDDVTQLPETESDSDQEAQPEWIGRYRLLEQIGEGGMGEVYLAEQSEPVRRRVALKLIKLGMDTKNVVARFEQERQALAVMDHPNIAHVYDAGATPTGRPYFVMELVRGVPITRYCDRIRLPLRDRLTLFISVCQAIQHAHQKGVIHRDIKPSNILVGDHDGGPLPKIIDFGLAKATGGRLTDRSLHTGMGQFLGTPAYMSPEQAALSDIDIDTRTDVYSLGLVLYELLTGALPFGKEESHQAGFLELQRRISEEEPPTPSTMLTKLLTSVDEVAEHRHTDPGALLKEVRGDLDWIVMKALERDRTRRYDTANGLALDVQRYLNREPILARPPSARYRATMFVHRNKLGVALASLLTIVFLAGTVGTAVGFFRAQREARKAITVTTFITSMLSTVDPEKAQGHEMTVREALDEAALEVSESFAAEPELEAELRATIGSMYTGLGLDVEALPHLERSVYLYRQTLGPTHTKTNQTLNHLGRAYLGLKQFEKAASLWEALLPVCQEKLGEEDPESLTMMQNLAAAYLGMKRHDRAEPLLVDLIEARRRVLGDDDRKTTATMNNLAHLYMDTDRFEQAEPLFRMALEIRTRTLGTSHPRTLISTYNLGDLYHKTERPEKAEPLIRDALDGFERVYGQDHPYTLTTIHSRAENLLRLGRLAEAEKAATDSYERHRDRYGPDREETVAAVELLVELYEKWGRDADAAKYRSRLP